MKIVFFGNEQLAQGLVRTITPCFDALLESEYEVVALVLPREPGGRSRGKSLEMVIVEKARAKGVRVIFADSFAGIEEFNNALGELGAEIGVLASFGKIVKKSTIELFPGGILNIHPSLLPKYRGTTPIETAIMNGDSVTGVSLMGLVVKMDAGPVYAQASLEVAPNMSKQEIYEKLASLGAGMLMENLPFIVSGEAEPWVQDEDRATYTQMLSRDMSQIKPDEYTAEQILDRIRAFIGFPKSKMELAGVKITVVAAKVSSEPSDGAVRCKDGMYLELLEIIPENGKRMTVQAFLNGRK
ncbi:methionyl-tRNA formyltransferase [Candidatus Saccharibacteria bacterium]|nr:methionyl-tRNA formyltransferase [Candidatus Saccharibacteria bacterium]